MNKINYKTLRVKLGISQREAAKRCGVSVNTWQSWEHGASDPRPERMVAINKMIQEANM